MTLIFGFSCYWLHRQDSDALEVIGKAIFNVDELEAMAQEPITIDALLRRPAARRGSMIEDTTQQEDDEFPPDTYGDSQQQFILPVLLLRFFVR